MFEEGRPHLLALPATVMQYFIEQVRSVCDDTRMIVDHSSYAARPVRIGTKVPIQPLLPSDRGVSNDRRTNLR